MGVTWGSAALGPCSLHIGSQEPPVRHGLIVLRWPQKRAANAISPGSKKAKQGRRENRTRVKPSTLVFRPTPIAPKTQNPRRHPRRPGTSPTSAPTSARDPLLYAISEVLERTHFFGISDTTLILMYCNRVFVGSIGNRMRCKAIWGADRRCGPVIRALEMAGSCNCPGSSHKP